MEKTFEKSSFNKRLHSMLKVDFRRMFQTPFFYILASICLSIPILTLVMTTMMVGDSGAMGTFTNVWQAIGSESGAAMAMDLTGMCNINLMYFLSAVLVCVFVGIYLLLATVGKSRTWLSLIASFMAGMLLFMIIPMMTPIDATIIHVVMCLAGGVLFSAGLGVVSCKLL